MNATTQTAVALTNAEIAAKAPATFAKKPSKRVSERYGFIPTTQIVEALRAAGFVPVSAVAQRSYKGSDNDKFGRHTLRFRLANGNMSKPQVGDVIPEVIVSGSHNGRTRFVLRAGLYRLVCANGMTVATSNFGEINVRHSPGVLETVTKAASTVIKDAVASLKVVSAMQSVKLDDKTATQFAKKALGIRYRASKEETAPVQPEAILAVRRKEDEGMDLWRVFNRCQEALTKGGMDGVAASGRRVHVRQLTSTGRDAQVNYDLWQLALDHLKKARKLPKLTSALATKEDAVH